jgi:CheY-like chemotaxis protein
MAMPCAPRVLLVDDDAVSLALTALLLQSNGAQVEPVLGGQQALERLRAVPLLLDVVLIDRQMPGVSGADVARFVRSLPAPRPRVIAISAAPLPSAEQGIFDRALLKPLDREQLRAAMQDTSADPLKTTQPLEAAALDSSRLQKLQQLLPPGAIAELYAVYLADTRDRIAELERCSAAGDQEGLRRCAHAIKGSSTMIGVPGIATIAAGLESGEKSPQEYSKLFLNMRSACNDVERSLAREIR